VNNVSGAITIFVLGTKKIHLNPPVR